MSAEDGAVAPRDTVTTVTLSGAVLGLVGAVLALLVAAGVELTPAFMTAVTGLVSAALVALPLIVRRLAVARARVVEVTDNKGLVTAGPANDLAVTGEYIRTLGEATSVEPYTPTVHAKPVPWELPD